MNIVLVTIIFAAALAFILSVLLAIFRKVFNVKTDVLVSLIRDTLPGANCGACGFPGCDGFATAVADHEAAPDKCTVSSAEETKKRAELVGGKADIKPVVAVVACRGTKETALPKGIYTGLETCRGAKIGSGGTKLCAWGCMGFGDCVNACKFGALSMGADGIPVVDFSKCKGCKVCAGECPQGIIRLIPKEEKGAFAFCNNRNTIKAMVKKTCKAGCIKCGACAKKCPSQAITIENGIPNIDYSKCNSCGTCVEACPQKSLLLIEKSPGFCA
ncbi:MAG: RnfABCDGE type electron transport complex subunit B [Spirochaetaceae bacterium]|jgi:Na+-translocating ferredoxin:NAD+ oxidoreductase RNF subunit RnfB|nr:RnfABCDGE type electron transport complex subunit B [Spirochaetaceae bacterium]